MNTARLRLEAVEVAPNDWQRVAKVSKTIIDGENGALEQHRIELANKLKSHYYDMCNQLSRNEGVWISGNVWTYVMWFTIACYLYTFVSLILMLA